jgi:hypothetical protein
VKARAGVIGLRRRQHVERERNAGGGIGSYH